MGRPPSGEHWVNKNIPLTKGQVDTIEAIRKVAPFGKPSFVAVVRKALDEFIDRQMADSALRSRIVAAMRESGNKIVSLRTRKPHRGQP